MSRQEGNERTIDDAVHDAEAARMRALSMSYQQIADAQGISKSTAHKRVQRAIAAVPVEAVNELRALELDRLDRRDRELVKIINTTFPLVSHGKLMRGDDGKPLEDVGPRLAALREWRANGESRRRLTGMDAPTRSEVTVITRDTIDQAIADLEAQLAEQDAPADRERSTPGTAAVPAGTPAKTRRVRPTKD